MEPVYRRAHRGRPFRYRLGRGCAARAPGSAGGHGARHGGCGSDDEHGERVRRTLPKRRGSLASRSHPHTDPIQRGVQRFARTLHGPAAAVPARSTRHALMDLGEAPHAPNVDVALSAFDASASTPQSSTTVHGRVSRSAPRERSCAPSRARKRLLIVAVVCFDDGGHRRTSQARH